MPWPYMPDQCPTCYYLERLDPPFEDEAGYTVPGLCGHPSIGMELFIPKQRADLARGPCPLRIPAPTHATRPR
jgi:hypothetical protein